MIEQFVFSVAFVMIIFFVGLFLGFFIGQNRIKENLALAEKCLAEARARALFRIELDKIQRNFEKGERNA